MSPIPPTDFKQAYFKHDAKLLAEYSEREPFDIIIIGSGFGGGVLAGDLYEKNRELEAKNSNITAESTARDSSHQLDLNLAILALAETAEPKGSPQAEPVMREATELCNRIKTLARPAESVGSGSTSAKANIESVLEHIKTFITKIQGPLIAQVILDHAKTQFYPSSQLPSERPQRILVIERGDLTFHSHSMNGPHPPHIAAAQANDIFYKTFRSEFKLGPSRGKETWDGGPVYTLGGRSTVWGLFAPRYMPFHLEFCDWR
jgi:choline dehydrogenase-like flavoprotein